MPTGGWYRVPGFECFDQVVVDLSQRTPSAVDQSEYRAVRDEGRHRYQRLVTRHTLQNLHQILRDLRAVQWCANLFPERRLRNLQLPTRVGGASTPPQRHLSPQ